MNLYEDGLDAAKDLVLERLPHASVAWRPSAYDLSSEFVISLSCGHTFKILITDDEAALNRACGSSLAFLVWNKLRTRKNRCYCVQREVQT